MKNQSTRGIELFTSRPFIHLLTHPLSELFSHKLSQNLTHHSLIHSFFHLFIQSHIYALYVSLTHYLLAHRSPRTPEEKEADRLKRKKANEKNTDYKRINKAATHFNGPRAIRR